MVTKLLRIISLVILMCNISLAQQFWSKLGAFLNGSAQCFVADKNGNALVGTSVGGIYRSTDKGDTWTLLDSGSAIANVQSLAIDSSGNIFAGTGNGVYRSTDNGGSWIQLGSGLNMNTTIFSLAVSPSGYLFATTNGSGAYRSTDDGNSWSQVVGGYTFSVAFNSSGDVFISTYGTIESSTDGGNTWTSSSGPTGSSYAYISLAINATGSIFVGTNGDGLFRSLDGGKNWTQLSNGIFKTFNGVSPLAISTSGEIFAAVGGDLSRSSDNGDSWTLTTSGLTGPILTAGVSGCIFDVEQDGVYRSTDSGNTWKLVASTLAPTNVYSILVCPGRQTMVGTSQGLFASADSGAGWTKVFSPAAANIYSLSRNSSAYIFAGGDNGAIYRSTDGGDSWQSMSTSMPQSPVEALVTSPSGTVFAGTAGGGVYSSSDDGGTWSLSGLGSSAVYALCADSLGNVYAGTYQGVFVSSNNGNSWSSVQLSTSSIYSITTDGVGHIYAGSDNGTIYESTDRGNSWSQFCSGIASYPVAALTANCAGDIYVGFDGGGVFQSTNMGRSWASIDSGLANLSVRCLAIDHRAYLYAGTDSSWVFRSLKQTAPVLTLSATALSFGQVALGKNSFMNVTLADSSIDTLVISNVRSSTDYFLTTFGAPAVVPPDSQVTIKVFFRPPTYGPFADTLFIVSNGGVGHLELAGISPPPIISVLNSNLAFTAKAGQTQSLSVMISDSSINPLVIDSARTTTKYFRVTTTFPDTLIEGDTASISVSFMPDSVRNYEDTLSIYSDSSTSAMKIALAGAGSTPAGLLREGNAIPTVYELYQNYPNPFNPSTTIEFALPEQSQVTVTIYDVLGREIKELVDEKLQAGYYHFVWDASRFASGIYFYRIVAQSLAGDRKDFMQVKKVMFIK